MKHSLCLSVLLAVCGLASSVYASTVAFMFSNGTSNVLSGFANSAGVATNGMRYGIVIDTAGNGFNAGAYTDFDTNVGGFLSTLSGLTDDYFWSAVGNPPLDPHSSVDPSGLTFDSTGFSEAGGGVGGAGTVSDILKVPFGVNGITTNDVFQLIWFQSSTANAGDRYGMFSHSSFLIPGGGAFENLSGNFGTTDPIKPANFTIQAIPEPSRAMLVGLGVLGMVFRRRRH